MKNRVMTIVQVLGLLWVGSVATLALGEEKIELGIHLEPGQSMTMELLIDQQIDQEVMNQEIAMSQTIGMTMRFDVLDQPSDVGGDWVEVTYTRMRFKQSAPKSGIEVDYDSDHPPAELPLAARAYAGLVGQKLRIEFSAEGEMVQMQGVAELMDHVIAAMDLPEGPARDAVADAVKAQLNEESLKQMMVISNAMFPETPVARGDTWDDTQAIGGMMPMTIVSQYRLMDYDDDTATLDMTGTIGPNPDAPPFDLNNMQMDAEMTGTQAGQIVLDRHTGWVISSKVRQDMVGGITMVMGNGESVDIDMTIKGNVTVTTLD